MRQIGDRNGHLSGAFYVEREEGPTVSKWGALADMPTCGHKGCFMHRLNNDTIKGKWVERSFNDIVGKCYTSEELRSLRQVANELG